MTGDKKLITKRGLQKLEEELNNRINVLRKEIANKLNEAAAIGDRSENTAYTQAIEEYQFNEARIKELKSLIRSYEVAPNKSGDLKIDIGDVVTLRDESGDERVYTLVGSGEGNPEKGYISSDSVVGSQIVGKKKGDKVRIILDKGEKIFEIIDVK